MNKKVLIISSSPRKGGNSETLAAAFAKGAREAGNQVETVYPVSYTHLYVYKRQALQETARSCPRLLQLSAIA